MDKQPWYYFLTIERDFVRTLDFVHFHKDNYTTYSNEFAKLMLLTGSEIDVVAKMLCKRVNPQGKAGNIDEYRQIICGQFPKLYTIEIDIARFDHNIKPWLSWDVSGGNAPAWWRAHTNVKHHRDRCFSEANLMNTASALCGLFALLLYYYNNDHNLMQPQPGLLEYGFPAFLTDDGGKRLPDF